MADLQQLPRAARLAFSAFNPAAASPFSGELAELEGGVLRALQPGELITLPDGQSHFGYICGTSAVAMNPDATLVIPRDFYFSLPGRTSISLGDGGYGIVVSAYDYRSYTMMGHLEEQGRLRYIDGCTDSLLIAPIKKGDPCLNLLYFPPMTDQTMHTHPSDRIGLILSGRGVCVTEDERGHLETPLIPGMLFCIHTGGQHKFRTEDHSMRVLAFHPDSDFGPTDEVHPMINRTMIDGVSASELTAIHTKTALK